MAEARILKGEWQTYLGNRLKPVSTRIVDNGIALDLGAYTTTFRMLANTDAAQDDPDAGDYTPDYNTASPIVSAGSCTVQPTRAFTVDTANDQLICVGHGITKNWKLYLASSGTLPTGLTEGYYFAVDVSEDRLGVSLEPNGEAVDITAAGSGTHSLYIVGHVQYAFAANDVDAAGLFGAWFDVTAGGLTASYPPDKMGLVIVIYEAP